ncbi:hypothetical protein BJ878DRAFT_497353 [Calycina marina]|uniref:Uncharacterized protein n=1 Tax=Calycina marina TaxID=1763456 RepID=A0A9P7Z7L4_9HELO|nr:hypothetical protein BJ878DRAFT_497353 [Calycina marina]
MHNTTSAVDHHWILLVMMWPYNSASGTFGLCLAFPFGLCLPSPTSSALCLPFTPTYPLHFMPFALYLPVSLCPVLSTLYLYTMPCSLRPVPCALCLSRWIIIA